MRDERDTILVAAAQRGERQALEELLGRHYDRVRSICRRVTGNDADADDATQHALLAITKGIAGFDGTASFATWLYRVSTNAALDEVRRRGRRPLADADVFEAAMGARGGESLDGAAARRLDVNSALARLPAEFRAPVVLRDLCGLDYAEIAEILSIPPGTVRSRIARGRAALAPLLAPLLDLSEDGEEHRPHDREPDRATAASNPVPELRGAAAYPHAAQTKPRPKT